MLFQNAAVLREDSRFETGCVRVRDGRIAEIGDLTPQYEEETVDVGGRYLIPGLVETHFHGALSQDCSCGDPAVFGVFSDFMASRGITSFVPALISSPDDVTETYLRNGAAYMDTEPTGSRMIGMYLEGPFLSQQYKGAHDPAVLQMPNLEKLQRWQGIAQGRIVKMIIAPELPGAGEVIRWGAQHGISMEIGHSGATYEEAMEGIRQGATVATHTFNAMAPLTHRNPGILGAVLTEDAVTCELICDFGHVAPPVVKLVIKAKGYDRVDIVSDSHMSAGMGDGTYVQPDGRTITVKNGLAYLENGTILGSASTILDGLRHVVSLGVPLGEAVKMASTNPARTAGQLDEIGTIAVGKRADLVVLDKDLQVCRTYVGGRLVYTGQ